MDRQVVLNLIMQEAEEMDDLVMAMANIAEIIIGDMEDGIGGYDGVVHWHRINIHMDDFLTMGDPSFRLHFRMTRTTFEALVEVVGNHLVATFRLQRIRTPLSFILMMVLWVMATPDSFRSIALQFGVRPGTVHFHYLYVIEALRELASRYIKWPNAEERAQIKDAFHAATGFPGVIGCIDGTHHYITAPRHDAARYINRHHTSSMNTQAVCDHNLIIRDIYVGEAGSLHDSRVFRRSPLCRNLLEDEDMLSVDEHILGDGGYILTDSVRICHQWFH